MNVWGRGSKENLATVDERLVAVANLALQVLDHSVIQGHRGEEEQNRYFDKGTSKLRFPLGRHNSLPSLAIDIQPYPYPSSQTSLREALSRLAGVYQGIAAQSGINIRWGGDWDMDTQTKDNKFDDLVHFELKK